MLLSLTADLHAASRDQKRWPQAWAALCQWFDCPEVFGNGELANTDLKNQLKCIALCSTNARNCAKNASGRCGSGLLLDENKRRSCLALVDHLDHALSPYSPIVQNPDSLASELDLDLLANTSRSVLESSNSGEFGSKLFGISVESLVKFGSISPELLESLPFPIFVCDTQRRILLTNRLGESELTSSTWLCCADECIVGASHLFERRIASALHACIEQNGEHRLWLVGSHQKEIDLIWIRVTDNVWGTHLVIRLAKHGRHDQPNMTKLALTLGLSARQRELAELLLGGYTLTDAAECMGIVRGSANELLKRMFTATGTCRQTELLTYLSRRLAS